MLSERYSFGWASSAISISREVREQGTSFWWTNSLTTYIFILIVLLINCGRSTFTWPHRGIYYTYWPLAAAIATIEELLFLIILIGKLDLSFFLLGIILYDCLPFQCNLVRYFKFLSNYKCRKRYLNSGQASPLHVLQSSNPLSIIKKLSAQ